MITRIVDNFTGSLTRKTTGQLNSGLAKYETSWGYDPFTNPGDLTWFEKPSIIGATFSWPLSTAKVQPDTLVGSSSVTTVYAYGSDQKLVQIQVNNLGNVNPNYDTQSVLAGFSGATTSYGGSMQFYGETAKIFIGTDSNILKVNFDGSAGNPSVATTASSVVGSVPRPSAQFLGKMYFANGNNLIEIDSTELVTSYAKLSPGFPSGTIIRDLDVTPDGNYLQITVSRLNAPNTIGSQDLGPVSSVDSYQFYWNGTDDTYTSSKTYGGYALTANHSFNQFNYTTGYDLGGAALYSGDKKIITLPNIISPNFGATFSISNMVGFASPEYVVSDDQTVNSLYMYGQYDDEVNPGLFRLLRQVHIPTSVLGVTPDVTAMPLSLPVSNLFYGPNAVNYPDNAVGTAKLYFSTIGKTGSTFKSYLYKFTTVPIGQASILSGVWESQNEVFSKKVKPAEVRFYTEPLVGNNSFKIEFVDPKSSVLGGQTFTVGTPPVVSGDDRVWWNPNLSPAYSWGARITNLGTKNWVGVKLEIDFVEAGK